MTGVQTCALPISYFLKPCKKIYWILDEGIFDMKKVQLNEGNSLIYIYIYIYLLMDKTTSLTVVILGIVLILLHKSYKHIFNHQKIYFKHSFLR